MVCFALNHGVPVVPFYTLNTEFICFSLGFCVQASGIRALNYFMSTLYKSELFLEQGLARSVAQAGWHVLAAYGRLAQLTFDAGNPKFTLIPKLHMYWHVVYSLHKDSMSCAWVLNPMAESCSVEEDVIGRYAFLTRHVSPRQRVIRSLDRYLTQVQLLWSR